jgi:16S rRNA (uracil1498-N3)-methyltransferase
LSQLQRITITPTQLTYPQIALTPEQQHYLGRVLRLRPGDRVIAMDGQGHWWLSELDAELKQAHILEAVAIQTELPISVTLLVAMPKGSGMDDIVRQATELGVTDIVPIISDRTLLNPSPQKLDRWRRIAQEAAEQAERQLIPTIATPMKFADALIHWQSNSIAYLCEARGTYPDLLSCLSKLNWPSEGFSSVVLATGPEGGWTEAEVQLAIAAGFQPVSLGQRVLRAVTAPLCALAIVTSALEPMQQPGKTD